MDRLVLSVLDSHNIISPPINLIGIIKNENFVRLELLPNVENRFGRIEYLQEVGYFIIFCSDRVHYNPIARFSLAHEISHYFLFNHREKLFQRDFHCSKSGFICDSVGEREADAFAAKLMIPALYMKKKIERKPKLALNDLKGVANECQTSLTCAAFRYIECDIEPCALILSEGKNIKFYRASESAENGGFKWLGNKSIPSKSPTIEAYNPTNRNKICSAGGFTDNWFSHRKKEIKIWEEAFSLGNTGLVLTLLYFEFEEKDDNFLPSDRFYR